MVTFFVYTYLSHYNWQSAKTGFWFAFIAAGRENFSPFFIRWGYGSRLLFLVFFFFSFEAQTTTGDVFIFRTCLVYISPHPRIVCRRNTEEKCCCAIPGFACLRFPLSALRSYSLRLLLLGFTSDNPKVRQNSFRFRVDYYYSTFWKKAPRTSLQRTFVCGLFTPF